MKRFDWLIVILAILFTIIFRPHQPLTAFLLAWITFKTVICSIILAVILEMLITNIRKG